MTFLNGDNVWLKYFCRQDVAQWPWDCWIINGSMSSFYQNNKRWLGTVLFVLIWSLNRKLDIRPTSLPAQQTAPCININTLARLAQFKCATSKPDLNVNNTCLHITKRKRYTQLVCVTVTTSMLIKCCHCWHCTYPITVHSYTSALYLLMETASYCIYRGLLLTFIISVHFWAGFLAG